MKFRGLIVAVAVLLVLGGLLAWSNRPKPKAVAGTPASASPAMLKLDQENLVGMTVARKGAAPVKLVFSSDAWRIVEPKPLRADQNAVGSVLLILANLHGDRIVADLTENPKPGDLKQFGLDAPALSIRVADKDGRVRTVLVGDRTPTGKDAFAMVDGDAKVYTIANEVDTGIEKTMDDLRDKLLLTIGPEEVKRVELRRKGDDMVFVRAGDQWRIVKPKPLRANGFAMDDFVGFISSAAMVPGGTGEGNAAAFAKAAPFATVTLSGDNGKDAQTMEVRKDGETLYAKSSATEGAFKMDASLGDAVGKSLNDFRAVNLFDFDLQAADKVEVRTGAKSWLLTRSGDDWRSNGRKMDSIGVEALIGKLRGLTATGFSDSGSAAPAEIEARVASDSGKLVEQIRIAKAASGYLAQRENEDTLYQLDADGIAGIKAAVEGIRPAEGK